MKCKNCGALLNVDDEKKEGTCPYCNTKFKLDDEVKHIQYDNSEQSGYEFEKGRIRAQEEENQKRKERVNAEINAQIEAEKKKKRTVWIVLAWIFLLPFTATYYIAVSKKLDTTKKIIFIILIWIFFFIIGSTGSSTEESDSSNSSNDSAITQD